MYKKVMNEIREKGLEFERFYTEACKNSPKRGLYNEYYAEREKGLYLKMTSTIIGQRELDSEGKEKDTRVRTFLIYVNIQAVTEKKERPKQYKFLADRLADKNGDTVVKNYLDFYMADKGTLIGATFTKKEAFEIVKNVYLSKLEALKEEETKRFATIKQAPIEINIEKLDNVGIAEDDVKFA